MTAYIQANNLIELEDLDNLHIDTKDSGSILIVPALTDDRVYILPDTQFGLHYIIILREDLAHNLQITAPVMGLFNGLLLNTDTALGANTATLVVKNEDDEVNFDGTTARKGDYLDIYCDGDNWQISGMSTDLGFS